jgi:hypothetical protein
MPRIDDLHPTDRATPPGIAQARHTISSGPDSKSEGHFAIDRIYHTLDRIMRSSRGSNLGSALLGNARAAALREIFRPGAQPFHLRELSRRTGLAVATVQRELNILVALGLVARHRVQQQNQHHAAAPDQIAHALRVLLGLSGDPSELLTLALRPFGTALHFAAIRAHSEGSDPPVLLVVGTPTFEQLFAAILPVQKAHHFNVQLMSFTPDGFERVDEHFDLTRMTMLIDHRSK